MEKFGNRAEDKGVESPNVVLARIDERLRSMEKSQDVASEAVKVALLFANSQMEKHFHDDKNNFAEIRTRITLENTKIQEKIDWVNQWIFRGLGGLAVLIVLVGWYVGSHK